MARRPRRGLAVFASLTMPRFSREPLDQPTAAAVDAQSIREWIAERPWLGDVEFAAGAPTRFRLSEKVDGFRLEMPMGCEPRGLLDFLREHEKWLARRAWTRENRAQKPPVEAQAAQGEGLIWIDGQAERMTLSPLPSVRWRGPGTPFELPRAACASEELARSQARSALKKLAQARLAPRLAELAVEAGLEPPPFHLAEAKSFWGQRDSRGRIQLRYDLIQMPPECQDHVIGHELAHAWHMDHSPAFWRQLARLRPNWRAEVDLLRRWEGVLARDAMRAPPLG
jgi:predicted metal-dependent hydrolase